jgi:hypothetical protein
MKNLKVLLALGTVLFTQQALAHCTSDQVDAEVVKHRPKFAACHRGIPSLEASFGQVDAWAQQITCDDASYTLQLTMKLTAEEGDCEHGHFFWYRENRN